MVADLEHAETRRFTADEVMRMLELGVLHEDEPVELLEGRLVVVSPQSPAHRSTTVKIRRLIDRNPVTTDATSHVADAVIWDHTARRSRLRRRIPSAG